MSRNEYRKRKKKNQHRQMVALLIYILICLLLVTFLIGLAIRTVKSERERMQPETEMVTELTDISTDDLAVLEIAEMTEQQTEQQDDQATLQTAANQTEGAEEEEDLIPDPFNLKEEDIYTFMQGPKAWKAKVDWSGAWCNQDLTDQKFSVFGCGLCALASIYSTLTPCECSPIDMFYYAQDASGYAPVSGYGAIDWPFLKQTLASVGISSKLRRKNVSYVRFRQNIASGICSIVLVCSGNDDTYWHDVEGHYVTIWKYDAQDDTVLLSDSGNPDHNRQRIPLRYLYDAMKTASRYQHLTVTAVDPDGNTWQHDGISIRWKRPKYGKASKKKNTSK